VLVAAVVGVLIAASQAANPRRAWCAWRLVTTLEIGCIICPGAGEVGSQRGVHRTATKHSRRAGGEPQDPKKSTPPVAAGAWARPPPACQRSGRVSYLVHHAQAGWARCAGRSTASASTAAARGASRLAVTSPRQRAEADALAAPPRRPGNRGVTGALAGVAESVRERIAAAIRTPQGGVAVTALRHRLVRLAAAATPLVVVAVTPPLASRSRARATRRSAQAAPEPDGAGNPRVGAESRTP
jgi:hypothetical protein